MKCKTDYMLNLSESASSSRSHQTWDQKVPGQNWAGQPGQHRHVQEAPLPGGNNVA